MIHELFTPYVDKIFAGDSILFKKVQLLKNTHNILVKDAKTNDIYEAQVILYDPPNEEGDIMTIEINDNIKEENNDTTNNSEN